MYTAAAGGAFRFQASVIQRVGSLINQLEPDLGAEDGKRQDGAARPWTPTQTSTDAWLTERRRKTAR